MHYLMYTYVDAVTGVALSAAAATNGPVAPAIDGLEFGFALESEYPTAVPRLFGTCPASPDTSTPGVLSVLTRVEYETALETELEARFVRLREGLIQSNNRAYESAINDLTRDYPPSEIATWERQRAEVIAWEADLASPTPWINLAASARGLDRVEYLNRTLAKVHAFAQASAFLTGRRQGIDDAIRVAKTPAELSAIAIDYTLPGGV